MAIKSTNNGGNGQEELYGDRVEANTNQYGVFGQIRKGTDEEGDEYYYLYARNEHIPSKCIDKIQTFKKLWLTECENLPYHPDAILRGWTLVEVEDTLGEARQEAVDVTEQDALDKWYWEYTLVRERIEQKVASEDE